MKKATSLLLAFVLTAALAANYSSAQAAGTSASSASVQQCIQALGIMNGDKNGNLNLSADVTRAQFATMMIAASEYKDTVSSTASSSPFKDVRYTYWGASYIQQAVVAGWLSGYSDGTFRPNNALTLEEAVAPVLKMLGYSPSDFSGTYPDAQLTKYVSLGLNKNISKSKGEAMTRQDCMYLFYNLMQTKTKSGGYYASSLGYTVSSSGELDYSSIMLSGMEGPFIVESTGWYTALPFASDTFTVYLNGNPSSAAAVSLYDVYYYNANTRTVWVCRNQVGGTYTAASPSASAPSAVTVGGKSYTVSTSDAAYALSTVGTYKIGDTVTLLLGMDGGVVAAVSPDALDIVKYGIVTGTGTQTYSDQYGSSYSAETVTVACTDGTSNTYQYANSAFSAGSFVRVTIAGGSVAIVSPGTVSLSGTVNSAATTLGSYAFADDIQIMDTTANGTYLITYPARLAGLTLSGDQVRYYVLNDSGKISRLILNDVTGDGYKYGILTKVVNNYSTTSLDMSGSYSYVIGGTSGSYSSANLLFGVTTGPALFEFSGSSIVKLRNLTEVKLSSLDSAYAVGGGVKYPLGDGVSVYLYSNGSYLLRGVSSVNDTGSYSLCGYYDKAPSSGGRIRVVIAYKN